jgi:hypothetical protein
MAGNFRASAAVDGDMRRALPVFFVAMAGVLGLVSMTGSAQAAPESADACVNIRSQQISEGLTFDLENSCEKRLSCALTWTLTCTNASGKVTATSKQEARFQIGASATHHTTGSSSTCKDSWKIDDVSWDCAAIAK